MDVRQEVGRLINKAVKEITKEETQVTVERPKDKKHGDFSTNIALVLTKKLNQPPKEIAQAILEKLEKQEGFEKIEVAGNGFINFYLSRNYLQNQIEDIIKQGDNFGSLSIGKGKKASVEYVSANPTGPLHMGNARGGPIGDVLARVLTKTGYKVEKEYLQNDAGWQITSLGRTIYNTIKEDERNEEEIYYKGEYVKNLALKVCQNVNINKLSKEEFVKNAGEEAVKIMLSEIIEDTKAMGISYDSITKESDLKKDVPGMIDRLQKTGIVKKKDGALWFASSDEFLKDRETVVRKSDGEYTYFASDIVYHEEKFKKGNDLVIDVWGSDHSGHVPRMKAAVKALGFNPNNFKVILYQFVRIKRGEEIVKMSKRAGNFITAKEVLDEVGKDAFRFFLLMHKAQTHIDFDMELAKKKQSDNPVFYVQYAHARICSILNKVAIDDLSSVKYSLLTSVEEVALIRHLLKLPELIKQILETLNVHSLTGYAIETATLVHRFYENQTVISENKELTKARLALLKATKIVLGNTLNLIGVSAPEKM